ncbi:Wzt carbohydrate-binding domain-containing protein [Candidatus Acidulodesulfobacterium sp. H_13]|uniref:Wzt carbohydrate-binding domain-containing protein n=1 Tax=Candidatus Acidulodesulfobacterium sp. H_13 TaxID=3395470 RepID=UPI003AF94BF5
MREKFGQDIFGTNTFHHEQVLSFEKDKTYTCTFSMPLNICPGQYSITAAVHSEDTHLDNCAYWLDHAEKFEVAGIQGKIFAGLCRLQPKIILKEII